MIWCIVKEFAAKAQIGTCTSPMCRRTCARLCHLAGGELEQIQFLLGHVSVQTTEKYLDANRSSGLPLTITSELNGEQC